MKKETFTVFNFLVAILLAFFVFSNFVFAGGIEDAIKGLQVAGDDVYETDATEIVDLPTTVGRIIGVGLAFIGVVFLILMIYGGFTWMLSRGNTTDTQKAKDLIEAAVIGLVIVMAAYAITAYVGSVLTTS